MYARTRHARLLRLILLKRKFIKEKNKDDDSRARKRQVHARVREGGSVEVNTAEENRRRIFAVELKNTNAMKKSELESYLEAGGGFTVEVNHMPYIDVLTLALAVKKGGGNLTLTKTDRLFHAEILNLCDTAPGHIFFPDKKLDG